MLPGNMAVTSPAGAPRVGHLLIIGAYRDNEVDPTHPLARKLDAIRKAGAPVLGKGLIGGALTAALGAPFTGGKAGSLAWTWPGSGAGKAPCAAACPTDSVRTVAASGTIRWRMSKAGSPVRPRFP